MVQKNPYGTTRPYQEDLEGDLFWLKNGLIHLEKFFF
jgi:hypothetical protein